MCFKWTPIRSLHSVTYDWVSKPQLHLQPQLFFFSTLEPLGDQTVVALTTHVSGLEGCWGSGQDFLAACFWWNSSGDLFSYASRPKWHYTFLSPSLFACSLIFDMRGPDIPSSRQRTNDNCRRLSKKAQVREMNWHLFSFLPLVPLVKRGGGDGRNREHMTPQAIWLCPN